MEEEEEEGEERVRTNTTKLCPPVITVMTTGPPLTPDDQYSFQIPSTSPAPATRPTWGGTRATPRILLPPNLSTQVRPEC